MIFYFSGTGNSIHAAKTLAGSPENVLDIVQCLKDPERTVSVPGGETLGIVCPVYYGGLPQPVYRFLEKTVFVREDGTPYRGYTWMVCTCGANAYGAGVLAEGLLKKQRLHLAYFTSVKMPKNYILMYDIPSEEEQKKILDSAERQLGRIREQIREEKTMPPKAGAGTALSALMYPIYVKGRRTGPFYTDDQCIRCGVCASRCPVGALVMKDQKPTWVKERCVHCMACARCGAIQYGKATVGRKRYTHPDLRKPT